MATYTEWTGGGSATSTSSSAGSNNTWVTYRYSTITVNVFLSNGKPTHTVEAAYTENLRDGSSTTYTSVEGEDYSITVTDTDTLYSVTFYSIARGATDDLTRTGGEKTITFTREEIAGGGGTGSGDGGDEPSGVVQVIDNGNNTFSIKGGCSGDNNPYVSKVVYCYVDEDGNKGNFIEAYNDETGAKKTNINITLELELYPEYTQDTGPRKIYAECLVCDDNYKAGVTVAITDNISETIKQYLPPIFPNDAVAEIITTSGKLTLKEPWILRWREAGQVNENSPLIGYYMHLQNMNNGQLLDNLKAAGTLESVIGWDNTWYNIPELNLTVDSESNLISISIDPKESGIIPGNNYILRVGAYTQFGDGNDGDLLRSDGISSDEYTAKNNGVLYVKVNGEWQEGQVYMKVPMVDSQGNTIGSKWAEAEAVYTRNADGEWEESTSL